MEELSRDAKHLDESIYNFNKMMIDTVKGSIDIMYADDAYARFFVLETVARVPYFAYLSILHLKETLGFRSEMLTEQMRIHYAEADNELHHLLIMEELGGNKNHRDRLLAQTMAFVYYWYVVIVYALYPRVAYHLSELIEDHAYRTYDSFLTENEGSLKKLSAPKTAMLYYNPANPYLDLYGTGARQANTELENLYDVFTNIRDDEKEHWSTLCSLVQHNSLTYPDGLQAKSTSIKENVNHHHPMGSLYVDSLLEEHASLPMAEELAVRSALSSAVKNTKTVKKNRKRKKVSIWR